MRIALALALAACSSPVKETKEQLGKLLFEDTQLSDPPGQACADCHAARSAFRDPESDHTTSMGVVEGRFGARNAPSLMYARYVPPLHRDAALGWVGGLFWDGRANSLEDQAAGPLMNPLEMNNRDKATLVAHVREASCANAIRDVFGADVLDDADRGFAAIASALAAYERGPDFAPFSSRYDDYLAGAGTLTAAETRGLAIFEDPARGNCASCHPSPLFTNFSYANLGIPRYANNKFYLQPAPWNPDGDRYIDRGLGAVVGDHAEDGKFRVPSLRDVARTAPYGHDGYFASLPYALEFIANRDLGSYDVATCDRAPGATQRCPWPPPEIAGTLDPRVGGHALAADELADLAAFLDTLTDRPFDHTR